MNHSIETIEKALEYLMQENMVYCEHSALYDLNQKLLETDKEFLEAPASAKHHHAYVGGLLIHTAQVWNTADAMLWTLKKVKWTEVFTAVLWHDWGKIYDYELKWPEQPGAYYPDGKYRHTEHRDRIGHLPRSYAEFYARARDLITKEEMDTIAHIMLAHHGRLDWRSPIIPQTAEAWCVHAADMLSAQYVGA